MTSLHINPTSKLTIFIPKPQLKLQQNPFSSFSPTPSFTSKLTNLSTFSLPLRFKLKSSHFNRTPCQAQSSDWAQQEKEEEEEEQTTEVIASLEGSEEEVEEAKEENFGDGSLSVEASENEEYYSEPPEDAKLFVGNLPYDVDSENLAQLFNQAGIVEIAEVIYNRETDQSRGFGFVTMSTVEEAEKAVEMFHRYDMNGRLLTVNKAAPRGSQPDRSRINEPPFRIYVGNLPWQVDDARLEQVFSEHGKVVDARVVYDRETGRSRGFGFVTMFNESELNDAIAALDGQSLDGRALRVNVAENRQRRGSFAA